MIFEWISPHPSWTGRTSPRPRTCHPTEQEIGCRFFWATDKTRYAHIYIYIKYTHTDDIHIFLPKAIPRPIMPNKQPHTHTKERSHSLRKIFKHEQLLRKVVPYATITNEQLFFAVVEFLRDLCTATTIPPTSTPPLSPSLIMIVMITLSITTIPSLTGKVGEDMDNQTHTTTPTQTNTHKTWQKVLPREAHQP